MSKFSDLYLAFAEKAIAYFNAIEPTSPIRRTFLGPDFLDSSKLSQNEELWVLARELFEQNLISFKRTDDIFPWSKKSVLADGLFSSFSLEDSAERFSKVLIYPLRHAIGYDEVKVLTLNHKAKIKEYIEHWERGAWPYKVIIPIHNLVLDDAATEVINFPNFKLVKIDENFKKDNGLEYAGDFDCVLVNERMEFSRETDSWEKFYDEVLKIITAIRLFTPISRDVRIGLSKIRFKSLLPRGDYSHLYQVSQELRTDAMAGWRGSASLFPASISLIYWFIGTYDELTPLKVGIHRFNISYGREADDDRLIDLAIALESSVLYGQREELKYRLGLRAAMIVRNLESPEKVSAILNTAYDLRSDLVHKGIGIYEFKQCKKYDKLSSFNVAQDNFIVSLTELVRQILAALCIDVRQFLYQIKNTSPRPKIAEIWNEIDRQIVQSIKPDDDPIIELDGVEVVAALNK